MGPADADSLHQALATQGVLVGQHEEVLQDVVETLQGLLVVQCLTSWQLPPVSMKMTSGLCHSQNSTFYPHPVR